jgi:hypothetical protein
MDVLSQERSGSSPKTSLQPSVHDKPTMCAPAVSTLDRIPPARKSTQKSQRRDFASSHTSTGGNASNVGSAIAVPSYQAEPPPVELTWNRLDGIARKGGSRPRASPSLSGSSNFAQVQSLHNVDATSFNEQLMMLPGLLKSLQTKPSPLNPNSSPWYPSSLNYLIENQSASGLTIEYSLEYLRALRNFVCSIDALQENGYVLQELSEMELDGKKRCKGCGKSTYIAGQIISHLLTKR